MLEEFDVVVPEVDMSYGAGIQFVIRVCLVRAFIILPGGIDAQCLEPGFEFAV